MAWRSLRWEPAVVTVTPATAALAPDDTQQLTTALTTGTGLPYVGPQDAVAFVSSDDGVATVDGDGLVTAVADGACVVTATAAEYSSATGSCAVTVETP